MKLRFALSGSIIFEGPADCVPPPGSTVSFVVQSYKKGFQFGDHVSATVTDDGTVPADYDFSEDEVLVTLAVNDLVVLNSSK
jgi:NADPH-dependent curcumin reductase CurA